MDESQSNKPIFSFFSGKNRITDPPSASFILIILMASLLVASVLIFGLVFPGLNLIYGRDFTNLLQTMSEDSSLLDRQVGRLAQGISHFFMFGFPSLVTLFVYHKLRVSKEPNYAWSSDLGIKNLSNSSWLGYGLLLWFVSLPLVHFTYEFNKALPLPEWMRGQEAQINSVMKGFLKMDSTTELLTNLLIVAVIPAVFEELMFRGVVQKQLSRRLNPWVAILIAAALFSAIHGQFEGFLPRWILGALLGWLFWKSNSLWIPIIIHFFNNGIQVVGYHFGKGETNLFEVDSVLEIPIWVAILSLTATFLLMRQKSVEKKL